MSICCLLTLIVIAFCIIIVFVIRQLYLQITDTIKKMKIPPKKVDRGDDDDDDSDTNERDETNNNNNNNNNLDRYDGNILAPESVAVAAAATATTTTTITHELNEIYDQLTLMVEPQQLPQPSIPQLRVCKKSVNCDFFQVYNMKVCKHLTTNNVMVINDKNTLKDVTYLHMPHCILVLITRNEKVCFRDQDISEDINYINSYISKYPDLSIYIVFFDKEFGQFRDLNNRQYNEYNIDLKKRIPLIRELLFNQPTAPLPDKRNFFHIHKN